MGEKAGLVREPAIAEPVAHGALGPSGSTSPERRLAELLQRFEQRAADTRIWLKAESEAGETSREETARKASKVLAGALRELNELALDLPPAPVRAREALRVSRAGAAHAKALRKAAEERIFELEMVGAGKAAERLGAKASNREKVRLLRAEGVLLGVPRSSRARTHYLYPTFQFDRARRTVLAAVAQSNKLLGAVDDPWGVASWWVSPSGWLGVAPYRCVEDRPHDVVAAAEAAIEWVG